MDHIVKDRVGIGIIGTGFARRVQIPLFKACEGAWIASVASGSEENAQATADEFGIGHFSTDWHDTVLHPEVDLVCITTPPNLHREMTLFSIEHKKHVICEKPMAMNLAEAEEMLAAAASDESLLLLIDHELRFQPGRQIAFDMLNEGAIGKVRHARATFAAPNRGDASLPWNWWSDASAGGGALGAINSHIIDSFNWFLGTTIESVYCQLHSHIKERRDSVGEVKKVTSDDEANMLLRFADGDLTSDATGLVSVSMTEIPKYRNRIELFGSDGALRIEHNGHLYFAKSGSQQWTEIEIGYYDPMAGYPDTGFPRAFAGFAPKIIEAIRQCRNFVNGAASFADGVEVQRVLDAARNSSRAGRIAVVNRK